MNNRFLLLLFILTIAVLTGGCDNRRQYKIAVSQCSQDDWRSKMNDEINREMLFHEDAVVEIRSADDSNQKQIRDIEYFIDNGFDIIIASPNEAEALTPVIHKAQDAGIPVIIFDRDILDTGYTAHIGADNVGLGQAAAEYALSIAGRTSKALELQGLHGSTPTRGRHDGFVRKFEAGGGTILASTYSDWNHEKAVALTDSLLNLYPDVNIIYAHNDRMAIGASEVARRRGREDIRIIGIDAAPQIGIQAVADGIIDASFVYPTEGHLLIRTALAILKGEKFDRNITLPTVSVVDSSNADILLMQNKSLQTETEHMELLKQRIDDYWDRHSSQTMLFYASLVIILLLCGVIFLTLRTYWQHKKHQSELLEQNKILEEQRDKEHELNRRLEEATQSKLLFYTNVSHDLRTPLTLISEPVAQLAAAENLTPQQHLLIKIADKNVRILRRLINQILDFRKYESDKLSLNLEECDLTALLREWIDSFKALSAKRSIRLNADIADNIGTMAIDVGKMERVVFNLLSNAFKYTPDNGSITVTCNVSDDILVLSVADTGQGIDKKDIDRIFDQFYQADKIHPDGSGIGLTLTKAFVELHDGNIYVESASKQGAVFTIHIPVRHINPGSGEVGNASASVPSAERSVITPETIDAELGSLDTDVTFADDRELILLIDDNNDIRVMVSQLLQDTYNVITARDGQEGLRKAGKHIPDLIICDVMMPGMDGLECCRRLKEEVSTSHIPVLMLTACSLDEQRVQGYDSGADGYLSKPFNTDVLKARASSLINNRKRIKEIWKEPRMSHPTETPRSDGKARRVPKSDIDNDFYNRFIEIFSDEMSNPDISVDALASKMGLERTQFYRKIKALTNFSPVELIRSLRLKHARHLLLTTDKTVSEISYDCGFSSPAYFTRCYREAHAETPTETRNRMGR